MVSLLLNLAAAPQATDPIARNVAFMASVEGLTLELTATVDGVPGQGRAKLVFRPPDMQVFTCKWGPETYRYVHSKAGALGIREDFGEYEQSQVFPRNIQPYGEFTGDSDFAYPNFLVFGNLERFARGAKTEVQAKETVRGASCDKLYVESSTIGTAGKHWFWVDAEGKVLRWKRQLDLQIGQLNTTMEITSVTKSAPSDPAFYAPKLPVGYMPTSIPGTRTRTRMVSEEAVFGRWLDARTNVTTDVAALAKGKPIALVFTDPDCTISAQAEPYLVSLRQSLKLKGCPLIEVSFGTKKPNLAKKDKDRLVFWDKDGTVEAAYGVPGTPYFLLADKEGLLVRGWQGYAKSMEADITKNLLSAFEKG